MMLNVDVKFGWVMDYPNKAGFFAEVTDKNGNVVEKFSEQLTRDKAIKRLRQWAHNNKQVTILMPSGDKL